ncbi:hypothetical protein PR001_g16524 [Phytophthora rubi]|uniref:Uncharacterized protein n=1 Tax=Phytophthora rubi TaxID=129364 RepID=A0A6A3KQB5_9STRA|nr:hypothetical protein PR001_g16524 [Phytophthora rubi]
MSTPTTQTTDAPAAPAAANAVVASTAMTATSSASSASVVTSTVTTSSSPKRTIAVGEYQKTRSKLVYARETLFEDLGVGGDVDMEEGEEEREPPFSGRDEASVGTRRPRGDDSGASSSKLSRNGSDRPLADAGTLSTPRDGDDDDSISPATVTSRTNPVRDPWMPSSSEIQSRYGSTTPVSRHALYSCNAIVDDDVAKELDFDPATDQRRDYYIGLFHELRFYGNKKHSRKSKVAEWEALCQSWGAFVENFNRELVCSASERYERFSKRPKILRLHDGAVKAGIQCPVPSGVACARCRTGVVRLSERDLNGYTGISVPVELKTLCEKLITQLSSESAEGERNTQPRARVSPVRLATGAAAVGRRHGTSPAEVWDRLEAVERLQAAELAEIRQELKLLKARIGQAGQTASNVQVSLGTVVARVEQRVSELEARIAPSHRE